MKVGIIGAGFTGLSAGYQLAKRGHQVTIFEKDNNRPPTREELEDATAALLPKLSDVLYGKALVQSYNVPIQSEEGTYEMSEKYGSDENVEYDVTTRRFIEETLESKRLTPVQKKAVILSFWGEMTQANIAEEVGLSQMSISRNLKKAIEVMREEYFGNDERR